MKRFSLVIMCVASIASIGSCVYAAPGAIKGTLACLKEEYKDLSLMHGITAWHTRAIEGMNDSGSLGSKNEKKMPKTIAFVRKLFYRSPGSSGPASFLVTKPVRELSNTAVAEWVAAFNLFLHKIPDQDCFKAYCNQREAHRLFLETRSTEQKKAKQQEQALAQTRSALLKTLEESSDYPSCEQPLKELGHYPIKAFLECADGEYMSSSMPHMILQALLYKKTEGDRAAFRTYYEWLDKRLGCLAYPLPATWEQDIFSSDQRETLLTEMQTLPAAQAYERWAFLNLSPTDYPRLLSYGDVTLQGAPFTDCMENTLRNVSNFLAYNPQTGLFDVDLLEARLGTHVHESVKSFYEQFGDPGTAAQKGAHNAWVEITSKLPNHVYCRALPPISHQKKDCVNVALSTPITTEFLAKKGYVSLPATSCGYDMRPSLRNFILMCDYLFGLQLFKDLSVDVWAREGFVKEQLPRLMQALKARVPVTLDYAALERNDGTTIQQFVPLSFSFVDNQSLDGKPYDFTLTLHIEHTSEYSEGEMLFNQPPPTPIALPPSVKMRSEAQIFMDSASAVQNKKAEDVLAWLFVQDLADNAQRYALMQQVPVFNERIVEILLFSARKYAVGDEQTLHVLRIYQEALSRGLADNKQVVNDAISVASEALHAKNGVVRGQALQLFRVLFAQNKGFDAATKSAAESMHSSEPTGNQADCSAGISLFKLLVKHGKAYDEADKAAQRVLQDNGLSGPSGQRPAGQRPVGQQPTTGLRFEATQLASHLTHARDNGLVRRKRIAQDSGLSEQRLAKKKLKIAKEWVALAGLVAVVLYTQARQIKDVYTSILKPQESSSSSHDSTFSHQDSTLLPELGIGVSVDGAVRTLLNTLSYNPETKRFDTSLLEQRLGVQVRQELTCFYAENSDPAFVDLPSVATAWEHLVSRTIPCVVYDCASVNGVQIELPVGACGFMKEVNDPAVKDALAAKGYVLVGDDAEMFAVKPLVKNVIIMLDYLLNLNVFNGDLKHACIGENFVATYLPKLEAALHAKVPIDNSVD